jgi:hypothetical protein
MCVLYVKSGLGVLFIKNEGIHLHTHIQPLKEETSVNVRNRTHLFQLTITKLTQYSLTNLRRVYNLPVIFFFVNTQQ